MLYVMTKLLTLIDPLCKMCIYLLHIIEVICKAIKTELIMATFMTAAINETLYKFKFTLNNWNINSCLTQLVTVKADLGYIIFIYLHTP